MATEGATTPLLADRGRLGRVLFVAGLVGALGSLVAGVGGWLLTGMASDTLSDTVEPLSGIVANVTDTIDASLVIVDQTTAAIESIERATRSTARTLDSVGGIIEETSGLIGGGVADGLDSAVATLPALVDTGRVIDRTMRALSLVGVDYDPAVPLDESLTQLEDSLRPLPDQLRDQVALLDDVRGEIDQITVDAGALAAVLLETRIDMMDVRGVLESASQNADRAAASVAGIEADLDTYDTLAKTVVVAVTLALLAAAAAPLLFGLYLRRTGSAP